MLVLSVQHRVSLAIINSAAMNIGVHMSLSLLVSSVCTFGDSAVVITCTFNDSWKSAYGPD